MADWKPRVVIIGQNPSECVLVAAQLQEETPCAVESAATIRDALATLVVRPALVIFDGSGFSESEWSRIRAVVRGAPILFLARRADREWLERGGVDLGGVMFRPFTVGDVVTRARGLLKEESKLG